jgi:hypothetical protein
MLGVVFIMVMMAATVPTEGFVEHLLPKVVSVFYYPGGPAQLLQHHSRHHAEYQHPPDI